MKVMVLRNTVASGQDIFTGKIVDVSDRDARILTAMGKVRPLTEADAKAVKKAMEEETQRVLKNLPPEKPAATPKAQGTGKADTKQTGSPGNVKQPTNPATKDGGA